MAPLTHSLHSKTRNARGVEVISALNYQHSAALLERRRRADKEFRVTLVGDTTRWVTDSPDGITRISRLTPARSVKKKRD